MASGDGSLNTVIRRGFLDIDMGDASRGESFQPRETLAMLVRDAPSFAALGLKDQPVMIVGMDLIGKGRMVLSLASNTIFVQH